MPVFNLSAKVKVSAYTSVTADTYEEAIQIAERRGVELGGTGNDALPTESWVIDEADGEAQNIVSDDE